MFDNVEKYESTIFYLEGQQTTFEGLIKAIIPAPILQHVNHKQEVVMEPDASTCVLAWALTQQGNEGD